jgi:uncharacterized membrane protein YhaH (DUF805 family)
MLHQFFGFRGRISRATYWLLVVLWIAFGPIGMTFVLWATPIGNTKLDSIVLSVLIVAVAIGICVSGLAIGAKRLHDRDRSGWWILLLYAVPAALWIIAGKINNDLAETILNVIGWIPWIWGLVELGLLRGTSGPNRFGPDPLAPAIGAAEPPSDDGSRGLQPRA